MEQNLFHNTNLMKLFPAFSTDSMRVVVFQSLLLPILTQGGAANQNQTMCRNVQYHVQHLHQVNFKLPYYQYHIFTIKITSTLFNSFLNSYKLLSVRLFCFRITCKGGLFNVWVSSSKGPSWRKVDSF